MAAESMVERVAEALFENDEDSSDQWGWDIHPPRNGEWVTIEECERKAYRRNARAALAAMREPTEAMITALLHEKVRDTGDQHERDVATIDWQFLIDEALK